MTNNNLTRNELLVYSFRKWMWHKLNKTSKSVYEIPSVTSAIVEYHNKHKYKKDGIALMYVPLHKSFWETMMLPCVIPEVINGDLPYIMMNTKRVAKGTFSRYVLDKGGILGIDRTSREAGIHAMQITENVLENKKALLYFAEGTRTESGLIGKFGVSGFQAAINVSKKLPVFIIPIDVAYPYVYEVINERKKDYGFKDTFASLKKDYGTVHISFGKPIEVISKENLELSNLSNLSKSDLSNDESKISYKSYRDQLTQNVRDACIDLLCILPENIHAEAIRRINPSKGDIINNLELLNSISSVVTNLIPHQKRFRGFNVNEGLENNNIVSSYSSNLDNLVVANEILKNSILPTDSNLMDKYIIYSNYIEPYLPKN